MKTGDRADKYRLMVHRLFEGKITAQELVKAGRKAKQLELLSVPVRGKPRQMGETKHGAPRPH